MLCCVCLVVYLQAEGDLGAGVEPRIKEEAEKKTYHQVRVVLLARDLHEGVRGHMEGGVAVGVVA
jgi:hypothetical protein